MGKRSQLSVTEQRDVVLMLLRKEESAGVLARRYGVSEGTLYRWRDLFLQGGQQALGNGKKGTNPQEARIKELEKEIEKREQVIGEMTIANRILKKRLDGSI
jgi:transposase-like protein